MSPRRDTSLTPDEMNALLGLPLSGVLSTLGRDGYPHSSAMWFLPDGDGVSMWTYAKSQKARNARRYQRAAFLVETGTGYSELRGIMIRGRIRIVEDPAAIVAIGRGLYDRYSRPGAGVPYEAGPHVEIERQATKRVGLFLPFERVASWDHSKL